MAETDAEMTPAQMACLLDAGLRSRHPLDYLRYAATTFEMIGRSTDCCTATWVASLYARGELEILMGLRAAWQRGEVRSPAEAARSAIGE